MNNTIFSCAIFLLVASVGAGAEPIKLDMKPGLWENQFKMTGDSAKQMQAVQSEQMKQAMEQMKQQLANMPPEQRKQMEAMMAQSGMKFNEDSMSFQNDKVKVTSEGSTVKQCVTQEEIDRGEMPENDSECKTTLKQTGKNRFKSKTVCTGDGAGTGESEVIFHSPKHYTGTGKMTQMINDKPQLIEVAMEGKWLSSDCGDILSEE